MGQVSQVFSGVRLASAVDKVIDAHRCLEAVQLPPAQPFLGDIDKLEGDPPFFEIPLRFPGVPALEGAEDLYVQEISAGPIEASTLLFFRPAMLLPLSPAHNPLIHAIISVAVTPGVLRWSTGLFTSTRSILRPPPDDYTHNAGAMAIACFSLQRYCRPSPSRRRA